jgi:hypothetical protein
MNQAEATGSAVSVGLKAVTAEQVLKNNRFKLFGVPLKDWIVCSECNRQQLHHYQNGGDFEKECWNCGTSHKSFVYFDELARSVEPTQKLYRLVR